MNGFEKAISAISPKWGASRSALRAKIAQSEMDAERYQTIRAVMTGYSEGGASHRSKAFRGNHGVSADPQSDIDANLQTLISRSRLAYMTYPVATSAVNTTRTNVIGSGLHLKARLDYDLLHLTSEHAEAWENKIEREFSLWAESKLCDIYRLNNFYEMQSLFFMGELMNGDGICLTPMEKPTKFMPYGLRLRLIESDRLCTPGTELAAYGGRPVYWGRNEKNGNKIYSGVEFNAAGTTVAYWFSSRYPYMPGQPETDPLTWTRVPAYGEETGRQNVLHMFEPERAEQRRGVPFLAPVLEELSQLTKYQKAELMAALVSALFTAFVTTGGSTSTLPIGEAVDGEDPGTLAVAAGGKGDDEYRLGNGAIVTLAPGENVEFADPKRPNTAFEAFVSATCQGIGAALEIPNELLLKKFSASFSASRGALLEAWKMFRMRRERMVSQFCQPVYELFLTEAVAAGRIHAPEFFNDPIIRKAWCAADWNGPAAGMLDPLKEVQAAEKRVANGFASREEETRGLTGGDFKRNAIQLKNENRLLVDAQAVPDVKGV
ncbi:phage portal protein [Oscillibacter ruminantium]|uniref:phage portal protein n=1 Tax=Oscillibacter ruminantium TaxID=1263547 RepID=UPI0002D4B350|nr:phage portal protein [Oscillibacter ruminantium]